MLAGVCAGALAGVEKTAVSVSNVGIEDDEELGVGGMPKASAPSAGAGDGALAEGVSQIALGSPAYGHEG